MTVWAGSNPGPGGLGSPPCPANIISIFNYYHNRTKHHPPDYNNIPLLLLLNVLNFNPKMTLVQSPAPISDLGNRHSQALIDWITISNPLSPGGLTGGGPEGLVLAGRQGPGDETWRMAASGAWHQDL